MPIDDLDSDVGRNGGNLLSMKSSSPPPRVLLTAPSFVFAVFVLALNDHLLKGAIGNWWAGKLSDVAGLFAFPIFWSSLLPRWRRIVFVATAVGFLVWKSPLSASPLASWNTLGIMPLSRIVDYSDWLALVALIPAYSVVRRRSGRETIRTPRTLHRLGAVGVGVFALLTFTATSVAPRLYAVPAHEGYDVAASRGAIRAHLDTLGLHPAETFRFPWQRRHAGSADTLNISGDSRNGYFHMEIEVRDVGPIEASSLC